MRRFRNIINTCARVPVAIFLGVPLVLASAVAAIVAEFLEGLSNDTVQFLNDCLPVED